MPGATLASRDHGGTGFPWCGSIARAGVVCPCMKHTRLRDGGSDAVHICRPVSLSTSDARSRHGMAEADGTHQGACHHSKAAHPLP